MTFSYVTLRIVGNDVDTSPPHHTTEVTRNVYNHHRHPAALALTFSVLESSLSIILYNLATVLSQFQGAVRDET